MVADDGKSSGGASSSYAAWPRDCASTRSAIKKRQSVGRFMLFVSCSKRLQLVRLCLAMTEINFSSHVPAIRYIATPGQPILRPILHNDGRVVAILVPQSTIFLDRDGVINKVVFRDGRPTAPR